MAEINAEREKMVEENGRRMRDFALAAISFSVDFGHIRTAVETEVHEKHISKIAQCGHRLDQGYSVDVRSG